MVEELATNVKEWAKTQKRVTNKNLRDRFDLTEDEADEVYEILRKDGVIGRMGYVGLDA